MTNRAIEIAKEQEKHLQRKMGIILEAFDRLQFNKNKIMRSCSIYDVRMIIVYAKQRNKERGIKILHWPRPVTLEHGSNVMIGVHPEFKTAVGPKVLWLQ
jgi:hypothetical protein